MPNTFLTVQEIAREALFRLESNMVMAGLVYKDYNGDFQKKGDTIQVKKPAVFTADDFTGTITTQGITEDKVLVKLDKIADVSVDITSKEMSLNINDFGFQVLDGATLAISEKIDAELCGLYKDIPYFHGTSGTTPNTLAHIAGAMKVMNVNKAPMAGRSAVWDPEAQASLLVLDAIAGADKSGSTDALRRASMGDLMNFGNFMDQNIKTHTAGGYTSLADVKATVDVANNANDATTNRAYSIAALTSTAGAAVTSLLAGDLLTIGGKQYTVLANTANAVAGVIASVKVVPQLAANVTAATVVFPDVTARGHVSSLAFHRNAFALVSRPMEPPMGGAESYTATSPTGLSLRVTMGYTMGSKTNTMSIDFLYGLRTMYPELAARILG